MISLATEAGTVWSSKHEKETENFEAKWYREARCDHPAMTTAEQWLRVPMRTAHSWADTFALAAQPLTNIKCDSHAYRRHNLYTEKVPNIVMVLQVTVY
jgi:hypothetical protein